MERRKNDEEVKKVLTTKANHGTNVNGPRE